MTNHVPELPEVQTIVSDLNKILVGRTIKTFHLLNQKTLGLSKVVFTRRVRGKKILAVKRRAKMIIIDLGEELILIHLKMTGQLIVGAAGRWLAGGGHPIANEPKELPNKFSRAWFGLDHGLSLFFNDVRKFGWIKLIKAKNLSEATANFGLEPLSKEFTLENFSKLLSRKKKSFIKQALLDQKGLVGLGNIYADEVLFAAKIKPLRRVGDLRPAEMRRLFAAIPQVLKSAIRHRGTSFSDYLDASGKQGNYSRLLKVYGRTNQPCRVCSRPIAKMKLGGRGTHWCDFCQK